MIYFRIKPVWFQTSASLPTCLTFSSVQNNSTVVLIRLVCLQTSETDINQIFAGDINNAAVFLCQT